MNAFFDWCVQFLIWLAPYFGMTYQEINIWLFVIIQPGLIVLFFVLWILAKRKAARIRHTQLR
jgi:hypothetical protein